MSSMRSQLDEDPILVELDPNGEGEFDLTTAAAQADGGGKKKNKQPPPTSGGPRLGKLPPLGEPRRRKKGSCCEGHDEDEDEQQRRPQKRNKEKGGLKWGPIIMMLMVFGPAILPAVLYVWDKVSQSQWGISVGLGSSPRDRLVAFYKKHNPEKLGEVDKVLRKYQGKTDELFKRLEAKYRKLEQMNKEEQYYREQDEWKEPQWAQDD
jgi:hypothetical protein